MTPTTPLRAARRNFWLLAALATAAMGALSDALAARPGPLTGVALATSATVLVVAIALAVRIMSRLDHPAGPRRPGGGQPPGTP